MMPSRGVTHQRLRLAAEAEGQLQALIQGATVSQGTVGDYVEPAVEITATSYICPNMLVDTKAVRLDVNAPGLMHGTGACIGLFALATVMDVFVDQTRIDPLASRARNG